MSLHKTVSPRQEHVRHEIILNVDGDADDGINPEASFYLDVEARHRSSCDSLVEMGYRVGETLQLRPSHSSVKRYKVLRQRPENW
jgi:hypothetical protein